MKQRHMEKFVMIGLKISYFRKYHKLTQRQVADRLGIDESHISKIERAQVGVSLDMLFDLADAIEVDAYRLLDFRDLPK